MIAISSGVPNVLGKVECCHGSAWCFDSNYGRVVKTRINDNPRFISIPHRDSKGWQKIYNKRTSVERTFSRLKEHLYLKNLTVRGAKKAKTHVLLSCIILLAGKIALKKQEERSEIPACSLEKLFSKLFSMSQGLVSAKIV